MSPLRFRRHLAPMVPRSQIRTLTIVAIALVAVLNGADVVTTHLVLAKNAVEANPLSGFLLNNGSLLWVKLGLVTLALLVALRVPPRLGLLVLAWFVAGVYGAAVLSNLLILRIASG